MDKEFVEAFGLAWMLAIKRPDARRPPNVFKATNGSWRFSAASTAFGEWYRTTDLGEIARRQPRAFLQGLYDAEGNLSTDPTGTSVHVRIFNQRRDILVWAQEACSALGLSGEIRVFRPAGAEVKMLGKPITTTSDLLCLSPIPARRFVEVVGSSIPKKCLLEPRRKPGPKPRS
jgi:intein-encoded DNA endonuclease-like protein